MDPSFLDELFYGFTRDEIAMFVATSYVGIILIVAYILGRSFYPEMRQVIREEIVQKTQRDTDLEERQLYPYDPRDDEPTDEERLESIYENMYVSSLFSNPNVGNVYYFPMQQRRR